MSLSSCKLWGLQIHLCFSCCSVRRPDASVGCKSCWVKGEERNRGLSARQGSERVCGVRVAESWCLHLSLDSLPRQEKTYQANFKCLLHKRNNFLAVPMLLPWLWQAGLAEMARPAPWQEMNPATFDLLPLWHSTWYFCALQNCYGMQSRRNMGILGSSLGSYQTSGQEQNPDTSALSLVTQNNLMN